jgi:hypothetical protein
MTTHHQSDKDKYPTWALVLFAVAGIVFLAGIVALFLVDWGPAVMALGGAIAIATLKAAQWAMGDDAS